MFAGFKTFLESLSAIAIIAGIGVYFILDQRETERSKIERSIAFATLLQSKEARAASFDLFEPLREYDFSQLQDATVPQSVIDKFVQDLVTEKEGLYEAIYETTSFYDTLQLCIDNRACDQATAFGLLGESAFDFYCSYTVIIDEMPAGSRLRLGSGLRTFATSQRACGDAPTPFEPMAEPGVFSFLAVFGGDEAAPADQP